MHAHGSLTVVPSTYTLMTVVVPAVMGWYAAHDTQYLHLLDGLAMNIMCCSQSCGACAGGEHQVGPIWAHSCYAAVCKAAMHDLSFWPIGKVGGMLVIQGVC